MVRLTQELVNGTKGGRLEKGPPDMIDWKVYVSRHFAERDGMDITDKWHEWDMLLRDRYRCRSARRSDGCAAAPPSVFFSGSSAASANEARMNW